MTEEKKEVESSEEDEQKESEEEESKETDESSEEEGTSKEDDFEKKEEFVPANKFNQAQRKLREAELEKRELEKKLAETSSKSAKNTEAEKEEKEEEDKFFEDEDEEKEEEKKTPQPDFSSIVDEKIKPVLERISKKEEEDRKKDRNSFFEAHPEYRENGEKWSGLLDTMDKYINPNSGESYYEQLNAAHILHTGQDMGNVELADKKREMAGDAASSGAGAQKAGAKEEFTREDRKIQKDFGVSDEGMKAFKKKIESGSMQILG